MVGLIVFPANIETDMTPTEAFIKNYVSYPAFHVFSHLAAVDETRLDDVAKAGVLEELYWLMRMFMSKHIRQIPN